MIIKLNQEQENEAIETLSSGGIIEFLGMTKTLLRWQITESDEAIKSNLEKDIGEKKFVYQKLKVPQYFDKYIKSLYKRKNNL